MQGDKPETPASREATGKRFLDQGLPHAPKTGETGFFSAAGRDPKKIITGNQSLAYIHRSGVGGDYATLMTTRGTSS
jgi:hypothetical protein